MRNVSYLMNIVVTGQTGLWSAVLLRGFQLLIWDLGSNRLLSPAHASTFPESRHKDQCCF